MKRQKARRKSVLTKEKEGEKDKEVDYEEEKASEKE